MLEISGISKYRIISYTLFYIFSTIILIFLTNIYISPNIQPKFEHYLTAVTLLIPTVLYIVSIKCMTVKYIRIVKHIIDQLDDVVIVKDEEGKFVFCNEVVAKLYDTQPPTMLGKDDYFFTKNREQSDHFKRSVQSIISSMQKENVYEKATDMATGEIRHLRSTKIPYLNVQNKKRIVIIAKDVTDIVQLQKDSERNKARLEHVLDVSQEGLWEWNLQTNKAIHNKRWLEIMGLKNSQTYFEEFEACIHEEDKSIFIKAVEDYLSGKTKLYDVNLRMKRPDGRTIWIWDRGRIAEYDNEGKPLLMVGIAQDVTVQKEYEEKINRLAYYDQLTGLYNRSQIEEKLKSTIQLNSKVSNNCALIFIDLDRFKLLNDSYGHNMGDRLLTTVASRLIESKPKDAIISRFGGDEFVVVVPIEHSELNSSLNYIEKYANELLKLLSKPAKLKNDAQNIEIEYAITASIGAIVVSNDDISTDKLLVLADKALYRAKREGGNTAKVYDVSIEQDLIQNDTMQNTMHSAISNNEFDIYLQPKCSPDGKVLGAEALIRWIHPKLGVLTPYHFLDIAEETNMILAIGNQVLHKACSVLAKWQSNPDTADFKIAINLSARQIWQNDFVEDFVQIITSYNIDHTKLIAEVTESVLIQDINDATEKLTQLRDFGISVSLDDFGTGYSSLNYLRTLPIDEIKIDRSFVMDISEDEDALIMIKSIIDLANNFNKRLVCEGVENITQVKLLKSLGVNIFQGFYFSKPIERKEFTSYIDNQKH